MSRRNYADGTYLDVSYPWGGYLGGSAICPDGRSRRLKRIATTADTYFSVPASISYQGRTVSGYVTIETRDGFSVSTDDDPEVVKFRPNLYGRNGRVFEETTTNATEEMAR